MADHFKLNFPIETDEAYKFWGSKHRLNRIKAIIAFSLDLDNANDNLRRAGYYRQYRKRYLDAYQCYVRHPDMVGIPFSGPNENWWEPVQCTPLGGQTNVNVTLADLNLTYTGSNGQGVVTWSLVTGVDVLISPASSLNNGQAITITLNAQPGYTVNGKIKDVMHENVPANAFPVFGVGTTNFPATSNSRSTLTLNWVHGIGPYTVILYDDTQNVIRNAVDVPNGTDQYAFFVKDLPSGKYHAKVTDSSVLKQFFESDETTFTGEDQIAFKTTPNSGTATVTDWMDGAQHITIQKGATVVLEAGRYTPWTGAFVPGTGNGSTITNLDTSKVTYTGSGNLLTFVGVDVGTSPGILHPGGAPDTLTDLYITVEASTAPLPDWDVADLRLETVYPLTTGNHSGSIDMTTIPKGEPGLTVTVTSSNTSVIEVVPYVDQSPTHSVFITPKAIGVANIVVTATYVGSNYKNQTKTFTKSVEIKDQITWVTQPTDTTVTGTLNIEYAGGTAPYDIKLLKSSDGSEVDSKTGITTTTYAYDLSTVSGLTPGAYVLQVEDSVAYFTSGHSSEFNLTAAPALTDLTLGKTAVDAPFYADGIRNGVQYLTAAEKEVVSPTVTVSVGDAQGLTITASDPTINVDSSDPTKVVISYQVDNGQSGTVDFDYTLGGVAKKQSITVTAIHGVFGITTTEPLVNGTSTKWGMDYVSPSWTNFRLDRIIPSNNGIITFTVDQGNINNSVYPSFTVTGVSVGEADVYPVAKFTAATGVEIPMLNNIYLHVTAAP